MKINKPLLITKLKATGVHLSLSIVVFIYLAYKIYYHWYPQPYFSIDGGWQGIRLVGAVDLVLGPFITFLIFDLRKKRKAIIFDLVTIAVIQFAALFYGVSLTYNQRPVAIVLIDEFMVSSIMEQYGGKLESEAVLRQYSDEKPPIIYAHMPRVREALAEVQRIKIDEKVLEHAQMQLYWPKEDFAQGLKEKQTVFSDRMDFYESRDAYEAWLQTNGKSEDEVLVARFSGRYGSTWLVFDLDGKLLSYF